MKRIIQTGPAILICLLAAVNTAPAGLLEYTPYGSPAACYNSTGMALNLKGVAMAGQGLLANPALIAETDCLSAQITMGLNWRRE